MALKATIFKAALSIADMDRHYYAEHNLTVARHPSETDERMMVRVLAFALNASESLEFGRGLSAEDEPALWEKDLTGAVSHWIEVGLPDERVLRKAAGRSAKVSVYAYGGNAADIWWETNRKALERMDTLAVYRLAPEVSEALAAMSERGMRLQASIEGGELWLNDGEATLAITLETLKAAR